MLQDEADQGSTSSETRDISAFARLVHLVQDNERIFRELQGLAVRTQRARSYLHERGSNSALGLAVLDRARARHAAALLRLRVNRIEAWELLGSASPRKSALIRRAHVS